MKWHRKKIRKLQEGQVEAEANERQDTLEFQPAAKHLDKLCHGMERGGGTHVPTLYSGKVLPLSMPF